MRTDQEIRGQVIAQMTDVYTSTTDLEAEADSQPLWGNDESEWNYDELLRAYTTLGGMFIYYAKEVESRHGPGFLEHLQRQATASALADDPPAGS
jgi:hypothetical protein